MRMIAAEANVDAALIHHFFTSKAGVYAASVESVLDLNSFIEGVLNVHREDAAEALVLGFLAIWENKDSREPILAILRSAVSHGEAADMLADHVIKQELGRIVVSLEATEPELRAALISSQLIGMAFLRYVLHAEPLASATPEMIAGWLTPTIDRYLLGDAPGE